MDAPPDPAAADRQVKVIILVAILYGMSFGVYEYALPLFLDSEGVSNRDMGWIFFAGSVMQLLLVLYATSLADAIGRKRLYVGGLTVGLAAYLLTPLTTQWWQGVFKAMRETAQAIQANLQSVLVYENAGSRFLKFFSWARGGEYACQAFGTTTAIALKAITGRFEPTFVGAAVLLGIAVAGAMRYLREPAHVALTERPPGILSLFRLDLHPKLYLLAFSMFLFMMGLMTSHSQYLLLFFRHKFQATDGTVAAIAILHRVTLGVPMLFAVWLMGRPRKAVYVCAVAAEGLVIAGSSLVGDFYWATGVWLTHDIVGAALWIPIQQHLILKYARPASRAGDVARVNAIGAFGGIFGPLLAGYLASYTGALPALFSGAHDLPYFTSGVLVTLSAVPLLFL